MPLLIGLKYTHIKGLHTISQMWYQGERANVIFIGKLYKLRGAMSPMIIHEHQFLLLCRPRVCIRNEMLQKLNSYFIGDEPTF